MVRHPLVVTILPRLLLDLIQIVLLLIFLLIVEGLNYRHMRQVRVDTESGLMMAITRVESLLTSLVVLLPQEMSATLLIDMKNLQDL